MRRENRWVFIIFLMKALFGTAQHNVPDNAYALPLITTYTPDQYKGGIQNWAISQDTMGYIYIANNYGLLEFDGASWRLYEIPGSTKSRSVGIHSKNNRIFVGGQKKLGYFEHQINGLAYKDLTTQIPDSISKDEIWDLVYHGEVIFANINGHAGIISGDTVFIQPTIENLEFITRINNQVIAASDASFYQFNDSTRRFETFGPKLPSDSYRGAVAYQNDSYLLFTYNGDVYQLDQNRLKKVRITASSLLKRGKVNRVLGLENGDIAIGTQNSGLIILNKELEMVQYLTKNKGLNHRTVVSLYEDNFNNLWAGLNNGVCVIELASPFSLINEDAGLEGTGYGAVLHKQSLYLGTSSGMFHLKKLPKNQFENLGYEVIPGSEGLVNNLSIVDNHIIINHHEGAFLYSVDNIVRFFEETGTWKFKKFGDGKLLGGTYEGFYLFDYVKNHPPKAYHKLKGLNESSRIFEFENDTTLWMTHGYKGAYKISLNGDSITSIERYGSTDGFPSDILISVYKIENELIFTAERGIYVYNAAKDSFEPHPFFNHWFADKHVSKLAASANGEIYFIANGEAGVLHKKSIGIYEMEQKPFRKINKFLSDDLENINILSSNEILFGSKEGFVLYNPKRKKRKEPPFSVLLKEVQIRQHNDSLVTLAGGFFQGISSKRPKAVRFTFSAPFLDGMDKITYAYRLRPYEDEWSEWTATNWKEYTNLPADDYILELKAKNIYGNESTVSSYSFSIAPFWFESNTAYIIYAGSLLLIFTIILYTREKKHHSEKQSIHQSKEDIIKSKEREISEFSAKTQQQIEALKNENLKKEIDHKNSQLASVTMHLLSKNEFVLSIRKKLNEALSEEKNPNDKLQQILKSIDKNLDEDEAWDTFVQHFDQVHGNFLHKLKENVHLTPQETKLCAYLKMNMSTKDIANLMNITVRGVELARYRLRKKLGISRDVNLTSYLENY